MISDYSSYSLEKRCFKNGRNISARVRTHADLHDIAATITRIAVALEIAGRISAGAVSAHSVHDLAFVDICARED